MGRGLGPTPLPGLLRVGRGDCAGCGDCAGWGDCSAGCGDCADAEVVLVAAVGLTEVPDGVVPGTTCTTGRAVVDTTTGVGALPTAVAPAGAAVAVALGRGGT